LHTDIFTKRSEFFRAARSPAWLKDPLKPVDLEAEDPEVFEAYFSCVYIGIEAIRDDWRAQMPSEAIAGLKEDYKLEDAFKLSPKECVKRATALDGEVGSKLYTTHCREYYRILAKAYLQADRLQDFATANLIIDEICDFKEASNSGPPIDTINMVYESTVHGSPLRRLMRDIGLNETPSGYYLEFHAFKSHEDYSRDLLVEFMRVKETGIGYSVEEVYFHTAANKRDLDRFHYHQH
jgi:hypothetical protein